MRVSIGSYQFTITAAVAKSLPVPMLLGQDVPQLKTLLREAQQSGGGSAMEGVVAVTTRQQARWLEKEQQHQQEREEKSGAMPSPVEEMQMLDDDLFQAGHDKNRLTRGQKREGRR